MIFRSTIFAVVCCTRLFCLTAVYTRLPDENPDAEAGPAGNDQTRKTVDLPASQDNDLKKEIDRIIAAMSEKGPSFNPDILIRLGAPGMRVFLERLFPETIIQPASTTERIQVLVRQLGDDSFARRETASAELASIGRLAAAELRKHMDHEDAEVRFRIRRLSASWDAADAMHFEDKSLFSAAMRIGFAIVKDDNVAYQVANVAVRALNARLDETPKRNVLSICFLAIANSHNDEVHNVLLPLLEHEDPAVPIFAMTAIAGRTGSNYVARIHMGALKSGRPELVKCALQSIPRPIHDRRSWPAVREAYASIFTSVDQKWDFSDDPDFMRRAACIASRDFNIPQARQYLLKLIASPERDIASSAMYGLRDAAYMHPPVYPEVLDALDPHLNSDDVYLRRAAVRTLGAYKGEESIQRLMAALQDDEKEVWQEAGRSLAYLHGFYVGQKNPVPAMLRQARDEIESKEFQWRFDWILKWIDNPRRFYRFRWWKGRDDCQN